MKIAIVHNLPSGGAKVSVYHYIRLLKEKHKIEEFFLSSSDDKFYTTKNLSHKRIIFKYKQIKKLNKRLIWRFNYILDFVDIINLNKVYRNIAEKINANNYDVVFLHPDYFIEAPLCLRYITKPTVYYMPEPFYIYRKRGDEKIYNFLHYIYLRYIKWLDKTNVRCANLILVNSKNTQEKCLKIYKRKAIICKVGVDTNIFKPINIDKKNFILSVGALDPIKGHDFIINAVGKIDNHIRPELIVVGDRMIERYINKLKKLAELNNVKLTILHNISTKELVKLYNEAKLVACAQIDEPFGLVPLEAMACKTPVVAVNEGGFKESIINNKTGILVERDEKKFAETIIKILEDKKLRDYLREEGYKYVINNWTWNISAKKVEKILSIFTNGEKSLYHNRKL